MPSDKKLSDFDGTSVCEAVIRSSGAVVTGLYLRSTLRNSTDGVYAKWYRSNIQKTNSWSDLFYKFVDSAFREHMPSRSNRIITVSDDDTPDMPDPLKMVAIAPLLSGTLHLGWLVLGYDNPSLIAQSRNNLMNTIKTVSEFSISILTSYIPPADTLSDKVETGILDALKVNDEFAFAAFSANGKIITSSERWKRYFKESETRISSINITQKWGPEWNRALNGETVKGYWTTPLDEGTPFRWTMIPWRTRGDEVKGVIVFSDISQKKEEQTYEQKTYLLSKFITIEKERKRLAKRLHDELGQSLSAALMNLELVDRTGNLHEQDTALQKTRSLLNQTISDIRAISQQLRPSIIDDFGLTAALKVLCNNLSKTSDKKIHFYAFQVEADIPELYQITVFRICQEALEHIVSYTGASIINVQLFQRETSVLLHIHDEDSAKNGNHWNSSEKAGIEDYFTGIKEQTTLHDGNFHMDLQTENGTELIIQFPLNDYSKELQDKRYEEN